MDVPPLRRPKHPRPAIRLLALFALDSEPARSSLTPAADPETAGRSLEQMDVSFSGPLVAAHHHPAKIVAIEKADPELYHGKCFGIISIVSRVQTDVPCGQ